MASADWPMIDALVAQLSDADKRLLIERLSQSLVPSSADERERAAAQLAAFDRLMKAIRNLPEPDNADGFSASDHDRVLYGAGPRSSLTPAPGTLRMPRTIRTTKQLHD